VETNYDRSEEYANAAPEVDKALRESRQALLRLAMGHARQARRRAALYAAIGGALTLLAVGLLAFGSPPVATFAPISFGLGAGFFMGALAPLTTASMWREAAETPKHTPMRF